MRWLKATISFSSVTGYKQSSKADTCKEFSKEASASLVDIISLPFSYGQAPWGSLCSLFHHQYPCWLHCCCAGWCQTGHGSGKQQQELQFQKAGVSFQPWKMSFRKGKQWLSVTSLRTTPHCPPERAGPTGKINFWTNISHIPPYPHHAAKWMFLICKICTFV